MRIISFPLQQALERRVVTRHLLFYMDHPTGALYGWSGIGDLAWNGNTYKGLGIFGRIEGAGETNPLSTPIVRYVLGGIDPVYRDKLTISMKGRVASSWIGFIDDRDRLIPDPLMMASGEVDTQDVTFDGRTYEITIAAKAFRIQLTKPRDLSLSPEILREIDPAATGFDRIPGLRSKEVKWTLT